jgi:hypothetical protein
MGYYLRYFVTDPKPVSILELEAGLRCFDPAYSISAEGKFGDLLHGGEVYGQIEINRPGDGLFDEEIAENIEMVEDSSSPNRERVINALRAATATVALQVVWQGRDGDATLAKIDPLWKWLFSNRQGLLQADGEGFYDESKLILEVR